MRSHGTKRRQTYVIGLGANLGQLLGNLRAATEHLSALPDTELSGLSGVYRSAPEGPAQPDFLNAAVKLRSGYAPATLLVQLQTIEADMGRVRHQRWGPRTLDLDILWADRGHSGPELQIPHVRLTTRWWAMRPLLDVAPELEDQYGPALRALGPTPHPVCTL